ncbi:hypothetical protein [Streptomyces sp. NRRL B-24720]|uniref:hypothetical protein n=1 Tax=Streptomyces sp. NRRL B-24720 TaxID=1476876 RepID=UPI001F265E0E|nr:hypothetical protein [Streptomyces sp. NRRL B-24720]
MLERGIGGRVRLNPELERAAGPGKRISTYGYDPLTGPDIFISNHPNLLEVLEQHWHRPS